MINSTLAHMLFNNLIFSFFLKKYFAKAMNDSVNSLKMQVQTPVDKRQ